MKYSKASRGSLMDATTSHAQTIATHEHKHEQNPDTRGREGDREANVPGLDFLGTCRIRLHEVTADPLHQSHTLMAVAQASSSAAACHLWCFLRLVSFRRQARRSSHCFDSFRPCNFELLRIFYFQSGLVDVFPLDSANDCRTESRNDAAASQAGSSIACGDDGDTRSPNPRLMPVNPCQFRPDAKAFLFCVFSRSTISHNLTHARNNTTAARTLFACCVANQEP